MDPLLAVFNRLKKRLRCHGLKADAAEDLIQEAFLRMQQYCGQGNEVRRPEGFLIRTAMRLWLNVRRDEHRDLYVEEKPEDMTWIADPRPLPDEVFLADQCLNRMRSAIDAVNRRTREVFFMNRLDGMTYAQIARQLSISVSAVEKHIAIAMAVLDRENYQDGQ